MEVENAADSGVLLDALPYIDLQYNDEYVREQVDRLVEAEMRKFTPADYLKDFPDHEVKFSSEFLSAAWERVQQGQKAFPDLQQPALNITPPEDKNSIEAWEKAIEEAQIVMEYSINSMMNLELLKRYGSQKWGSHNECLQSISQSFSKEVQDIRIASRDLNRKRKVDQLAAYNKLNVLEHRWWETVTKNQELRAVVEQLEEDVKRLKQEQE